MRLNGASGPVSLPGTLSTPLVILDAPAMVRAVILERRSRRVTSFRDNSSTSTAETLGGPRGVIGRVKRGYFSVRRQPHPVFNRNSFQYWMWGRFSDAKGTTVVRATIGLHRAIEGFIAVWFILLGIFAVALLLHTQQLRVTVVIPLAVLLGMALFAWALTAFGRWLDGGTQPLITWLDEILATGYVTVPTDLGLPPEQRPLRHLRGGGPAMSPTPRLRPMPPT